MEETVEYTDIQAIEADIAHFTNISVKSGHIKAFIDSPAFTVFEEVFVKGYRETSAMNVARFTVEQTANYVHHIKARAIYETFIEEMISAGVVADDTLIQLNEALVEANKKAIEVEEV